MSERNHVAIRPVRRRDRMQQRTQLGMSGCISRQIGAGWFVTVDDMHTRRRTTAGRRPFDYAACAPVLATAAPGSATAMDGQTWISTLGS